MRAIVVLASLLLFPSIARAYEGENGEMAVAVRLVQRRFDGFGASGYGVQASQWTHFGRSFGAEVAAGFSTGRDAEGRHRTDLSFLLPALVFRIPTDGALQPYGSAGFVMSAAFYNGKTGGMMYAGQQTALGLEWRVDRSFSLLFELTTTLRGRFAVDKKDAPVLAQDPAFDVATRVVHEHGFSVGFALF